MFSALGIAPSIQSLLTQIPTYQDFPLHVLICAVLICVFRKTIRRGLHICLGLVIWALLLYVGYYLLVVLNHILPFGRWWLVVLAATVLLLTFLPALFAALAVTIKAVWFLRSIANSMLEKLSLLKKADTDRPNDKTEESREKEGSPKAHNQIRNLQLYSLLGVRPSATKADLKRAYIEKMKLNHPDKVASLDPEVQHFATRRTQEIRKAYEILSANSFA